MKDWARQWNRCLRDLGTREVMLMPPEGPPPAVIGPNGPFDLPHPPRERYKELPPGLRLPPRPEPEQIFNNQVFVTLIDVGHAWKIEDLPEPELVARWCHNVVRTIARGQLLPRSWMIVDGDGFPSGVDATVDEPVGVPVQMVFVRHPWSASLKEDFGSRQAWMVIRGRFGGIPFSEVLMG